MIFREEIYLYNRFHELFERARNAGMAEDVFLSYIEDFITQYEKVKGYNVKRQLEDKEKELKEVQQLFDAASKRLEKFEQQKKADTEFVAEAQKEIERLRQEIEKLRAV